MLIAQSSPLHFHIQTFLGDILEDAPACVQENMYHMKIWVHKYM